MKNKTILIADDHTIIRYGILLLLKEILPSARFLEAETFSQVSKALSGADIDLLILDINIPGGDNLRMVENIRIWSPNTKILMFSAYSEQLYALRYVQAGAYGYLHKDTSEGEIKRAVQMVLDGKIFLSDAVKDNTVFKLINNDGAGRAIEKLSNRELDVAKLLVQGLGVLEISATLNLHISTISTYKKRIFEKLNVKNLIELISRFNLEL